MSLRLEQRLAEWATWYHYNKKVIAPENIKKQLEFQKKAIDGCIELIALAAADLQEYEGRTRSAKLWLPNGFKVTNPDGRVEKFNL